MRQVCFLCFFFFFNDTATTEIYTLSLHDALPISRARRPHRHKPHESPLFGGYLRRHDLIEDRGRKVDRKSTRLNSSHDQISYAVFCLKKKKNRKVCTVRSATNPRAR